MNISFKERKIILKWFDIAVEAGSLKDSDLRLYDKIRESVEYDEEESDDPLVYRPKKEKDEIVEEEDEYSFERFEDEDSRY